MGISRFIGHCYTVKEHLDELELQERATQLYEASLVKLQELDQRFNISGTLAKKVLENSEYLGKLIALEKYFNIRGLTGELKEYKELLDEIKKYFQIGLTGNAESIFNKLETKLFDYRVKIDDKCKDKAENLGALISSLLPERAKEKVKEFFEE